MSAKQFGYYDDWKTEILTCPTCGWKGTWDDDHSELFAGLMDFTCPNYDK